MPKKNWKPISVSENDKPLTKKERKAQKRQQKAKDAAKGIVSKKAKLIKWGIFIGVAIIMVIVVVVLSKVL